MLEEASNFALDFRPVFERAGCCAGQDCMDEIEGIDGTFPDLCLVDEDRLGGAEIDYTFGGVSTAGAEGCADLAEAEVMISSVLRVFLTAAA